MIPYDDRSAYFTFLDNVLLYDCVSCGSQCCQGKGIFLSRRELAVLEGHYPGLLQLASPPSLPLADTLVVVEPPPRCFFLNDDGRCRVEDELGRERKPTGCRLFPMQRYYAYEGVLTVGVADLCPLTVGAPGARGTWLRHDELLAELAGVDDRSFLSMAPPPWLRAGFAEAVARERRARDASREAFERADLYAYLSSDGEDAERTVHEISWFLGQRDLGRPSTALARSFIAAGPELRFRIALGGQTGWDGVPRLASRVMSALVCFAMLHERLSRRPPSVAAILCLMREMEQLLGLLARLDARPAWIAPRGKLRVNPQIKGAVASFVASIQRGARTLGEAIAEAEPAPERRAALLRGMGDLGGSLSFANDTIDFQGSSGHGRRPASEGRARDPATALGTAPPGLLAQRVGDVEGRERASSIGDSHS